MNKTITALTIIMASFAANASVLPETPVPFKSGTGAIDNDTVYIGLGSAGTALMNPLMILVKIIKLRWI
ncbi:hypothetical protein HEO54_022450, partial [Escherichia coli]|nr:hypothetical protein [Escherichia coli]MBB8409277.1 hypothetical protein [Escherichia coli]